MKKLSVLLVILILFSCKNKKPDEKMIYPETKKIEQIDNYFGIEVKDPYAWLENDTATEVEQWVKEQNKVTNAYFDTITNRKKIKDRLTELWNYPKYGLPSREGENYFFFKNDGLQPQSVLYIQKGLEGKAEVFLDPNKLSDDGSIALSTYSVSNCGKYFAYGISRSGSDWNEFFVKEVESKKMLSDHIKWVKFSGISWYKNGFFYSRFDKPVEGKELSAKNQNHKVYYHIIGTKQESDKLIYSDPSHPDRSFSAGVSEDEKFLFLFGYESTSGHSVYFKNVEKGDRNFRAIDESFDYEYNIIGSQGDSIFIKTNNGADNFKVISVNTNNPEKENWREIIPEKETLQSVSFVGGKLIAEYMVDVVSKAYIFDLSGKFLGGLKLPGPGSMSGISGKKEDSIVFYSFTSFTYPSTIFKYDVKNNISEVYRESEIKADLSDYKTEQIFYESKDGTKVPMFITHKKGIKLDGNNPVLLYGYGGFNISLTPSFSLTNLVFLENGGIYVLANIRGGGEYGEAWHKAGMTLKKQNVFDDFISAAEYLIEKKYTSSEKLAIRGGSNGGLLVGACITQRPELFKVALPAVGVMDMLKFHKFTIGHHWAEEYGSSDDSTQFRYLYAYSPLHNIRKDVKYPATLVTTADHDDRVVPAHSFKFIATLQEKQTGENPVIIRIEEKAGHGSGKPTEQIIDEYTDIWTFVFKNLGMKLINEK